MAEQQSIQLIQQTYSAFGRGDLAAVLAACQDDVEWTVYAPAPEIPYGGTRRGREQVEQFFVVLGATLEIQSFEPREFIAQDDRVVVIGHAGGRARATGHAVDNHWVHVFDLRDGKIARFREFVDSAALAAAYRVNV